MKPQTFKFLILLMVIFVWGVGCALLLPPFEGYDENAYYSSIKQVAYDHSIPLYGLSFLDKQIEEYSGPRPYPMEASNLRFTYHDFFLSTEKPKSFSEILKNQKDNSFASSKTPNWEAQHPPFYYMSMAPFELLLQHLSLVKKVILLRIIAVSLAVGAMFIAGAIYFKEPETFELFCRGLAFYPLLFPMFFWEFARIGSDSLCILLFSGCLFLLKRYEEDPSRKLWGYVLGILLGLGLLTKAFFIPILVAFIIYLFVKNVRKERLKIGWYVASFQLVIPVVLPALVVGAGWYFYNWIILGDIIGADDSIQLSSHGGLLAGLRNNFSVLALGKGFFTFLVSFIYAGTQSMVRIPWGLFVPILLLGTVAIVGMFRSLQTKGYYKERILLYALVLTFGGGIIYHMLVGLALYGATQTPAYYLHILAPVLVLPLGIFIQKMNKINFIKYPISLIITYCILLNVYIVWAQLALFSGCANALSVDDYFHRVYSFLNSPMCIDSIHSVIDQDSHLALPWAAICMFGLSFLLILIYLKTSFGKRVKVSHT